VYLQSVFVFIVYVYFVPPVALRPDAGHDLVLEVSRSTHHSR